MADCTRLRSKGGKRGEVWGPCGIGKKPENDQGGRIRKVETLRKGKCPYINLGGRFPAVNQSRIAWSTRFIFPTSTE